MSDHGRDSRIGRSSEKIVDIAASKGFRSPGIGVLHKYLHRGASDGLCPFECCVEAAGDRYMRPEKHGISEDVWGEKDLEASNAGTGRMVLFHRENDPEKNGRRGHRGHP